MEQNLDEFLNQLIDRHYKRLVNIYHKRLEKARDKEFAISLFVKRVMAISEFRVKLYDEYRNLMENLDEDYRLGRSIVYTINIIRKFHKKRAENANLYFGEIISPDEEGLGTEFLTHIEIKDRRFSDINNFTNEELIRLFSEYKVYEKFTEFITEEAKTYITSGNELVSAVAAPEDFNEKNKEFTTARQVLAFHYILKYCQVKNVDNTEKARFIQFLTGKNYDNIYKRVQSPLSGTDKYITEDLKFVRVYFEKLGMKEVVKMITNELSIE